MSGKNTNQLITVHQVLLREDGAIVNIGPNDIGAEKRDDAHVLMQASREMLEDLTKDTRLFDTKLKGVHALLVVWPISQIPADENINVFDATAKEVQEIARMATKPYLNRQAGYGEAMNLLAPVSPNDRHRLYGLRGALESSLRRIASQSPVNS